MIETLTYKGKEYPQFQASGNAARFILPFAIEVCKGIGLDIGYGKEEWKFPQAIGIDLIKDNGASATWIPNAGFKQGQLGWDYIFSSHCLEHLDDWVRVLDYWYTMIREGGTLFLYLPHPDQEYWAPWNNLKHKQILYPEMIERYMLQKGFKKVFVSQKDLNHSFAAMGEK